ncbi:unnamed protein product [Diabrotica balteata]|uniref:Uncharacterized protein n=1 Tax=Diabrotica balteata TaxID=107213 RepID=A0A9N9SW55_DIABA|nr:unnamed protein product [Diabrotica balteata]
MLTISFDVQSEDLKLCKCLILWSNAGSRIPGGENAPLDNFDREKPQLRPHQVHPVLDSRQTIICYDKPPPITVSDRPPSPPPANACYPLAPNICVEAGRIQFIRQEAEGAPVPPPPDPATSASATAPPSAGAARITVTRGLQTELQENDEVESFREVQIRFRSDSDHNPLITNITLILKNIKRNQRILTTDRRKLKEAKVKDCLQHELHVNCNKLNTKTNDIDEYWDRLKYCLLESCKEILGFRKETRRLDE